MPPITRQFAAFSLALLLTGCVMQPTREGYMVGLDTETLFARKAATFASPQGTVNLRLTTRGRWELKFERKGRILDLGNPSLVTVESTRQVGDTLVLALRLDRPGCSVYRVIEIMPTDVGEYDINPNCSTSVSTSWDGDALWIAEAERNQQIRYWHWRDHQMVAGQVPVVRTAQAPRTIAAAPTAQTNRPAQSTSSAPTARRREAPQYQRHAVPELSGAAVRGTAVPRIKVSLIDE